MAHDHQTSLLELLRSESVGVDDEIDGLLPAWLKGLSTLHFSPVDVARRAAKFLAGEEQASARILDVGSGVGKMCIVGAANTDAHFTGIERRRALVDEALRLARVTGVERVAFRCAPMESLDWSLFTGFYFFNPFGEQFLSSAERIGGDDPGGWPAYVHRVRTSLAKLYLMPAGTRVATYHGLGAPMPPGYDLVDAVRFSQGMLHCYVRRDPLRVKPTSDFCEAAGLFDEPTDKITPAPKTPK